MAKILVLHGPNLNLLGSREPGIYGNDNLDSINQHLASLAQGAGHELTCFQSNAEHELVNTIQGHSDADYIIINPAAFTHTSVAIRDALLAINTPFIEVHLSNIHQREEFRQHSFFSDVATGVICGLGAQGYELALLSVFEKLK